MHHWLLRTFAAIALCCCSAMASAQTCTVNAGNLASGAPYNPFSAAFNDSSGAYLVTCTRTTAQPRFGAVYYAGVDNGQNYTTSRRLRNGANYLNYALYQNFPACTTAWGATLATVVTLNNSNTGNGNTTTNPNPLANRSYCFRITGGINTAPPGTYTDTVTVGVADSNGNVIASDTVLLSTTIQAACTVTTPPATIALTYTSFSTTAPSNSRTFQMRCTNTTTYALGFDAPVVGTNDKVLGLNYTLASSSPSGVGNGALQTYTVTATIPANQAGTCGAVGGAACTGTVTRAVQITY